MILSRELFKGKIFSVVGLDKRAHAEDFNKFIEIMGIVRNHGIVLESNYEKVKGVIFLCIFQTYS